MGNRVDSKTAYRVAGAAVTNLSIAVRTASSLDVVSSVGTDATVPSFNATEAGLAPASAGGTVNFLRADGTWAAAGETGKIAIYNSSGVPTFYATLALAMTASVSGDSINLFANITETTAVTLKTGVNINGNGFKITFNDAGTTSGVQTIGTVYISKWIDFSILRTGGSGGYGFDLSNTGETQIDASGVFIESDYGLACQTASAGTASSFVKGIRFKGVTGGIAAQVNLIDIVGITDTGYGVYLSGNAYGDRCVGRATSGSAAGLVYLGTQQMTNSTGIGISVRGIGSGSGSGPYYNCNGISAANIGVFTAFGFYNGSALSSTYIAIQGSFAQNSSFISVLDNAAKYNYELSNCYLKTTTAATVFGDDNRTVKNCTIICEWNNAGGHGITVANNMTIFNNCIKVANASANCINGTQAWYANNTFEGATTPVVGTQLITNTSDSQGNILK